jgi:hypothetical protein
MAEAKSSNLTRYSTANFSHSLRSIKARKNGSLLAKSSHKIRIRQSYKRKCKIVRRTNLCFKSPDPPAISNALRFILWRVSIVFSRCPTKGCLFTSRSILFLFLEPRNPCNCKGYDQDNDRRDFSRKRCEASRRG